MEHFKVEIESIDLEGKGIARIDGKTVFINGVLPQEEVIIEITKKKVNFDFGRVVDIINKSPDRVVPECPNFAVCGGCSIQHLEFKAQIWNKQKVLLDNLKHIGKVEAKNIIPPILGTPWRYRNRARLSAKYVRKKASVLVGFREKGTPYVLDMMECLVLPKHISDLIPQLRKLIECLSIREKIPQIEVAVGENISTLVFRVMESLSEVDEKLIKDFVIEYNAKNSHSIQIWLQPNDTENYPFEPIQAPQLNYTLNEFGLDMPYYPSDFTQVNPGINNEMVSLAIRLLDIQSSEEVFDFFCGIGNFTLPIATKAKNVLGIEGSKKLVARANENALHNNLSHKINYSVTNLFTVNVDWLKNLGKRNKWLIDPPRDGALELIRSITSDIAPQKIVYVSCNPATLARDADVLVNTHGYTLKNVGVMNMFPHTSHVESIAEFVKE